MFVNERKTNDRVKYSDSRVRQRCQPFETPVPCSVLSSARTPSGRKSSYPDGLAMMLANVKDCTVPLRLPSLNVIRFESSVINANSRVNMVAASMTSVSARVAAKAGRTSASSAHRVGAFCAPAQKTVIRSGNGKSFSASVAARVSSVKVRYCRSTIAERGRAVCPRSWPSIEDVRARTMHG